MSDTDSGSILEETNVAYGFGKIRVLSVYVYRLCAYI